MWFYNLVVFLWNPEFCKHWQRCKLYLYCSLYAEINLPVGNQMCAPAKEIVLQTERAQVTNVWKTSSVPESSWTAKIQHTNRGCLQLLLLLLRWNQTKSTSLLCCCDFWLSLIICVFHQSFGLISLKVNYLCTVANLSDANKTYRWLSWKLF